MNQTSVAKKAQTSSSFPEDSSERPVLSVVNLVKDVGPVRGLDDRMLRIISDLTMEAYPGRITTLLGKNGAGKTTTLNCLQGLEKRTGGVVNILEWDPNDAGAEFHSHVGVMLQDGGLPPSKRPISFLKHIATFYKNPYDVDELVERLGIVDFDRSTIRRLSGGQKQRVALAAALIGRPELLFLDEPTAGLDPHGRQIVFEILQEQKDAGTAIVLTTHLLSDAQDLSDYVYFIADGKIVREGTIDTLLGSNVTTASQSTQLSFTLSPHTNQEPQMTSLLHNYIRDNSLNFTVETFADSDLKSNSLVSSWTYNFSGDFTPELYFLLGSWWKEINLVPHHLTTEVANVHSLEELFLEITQDHPEEKSPRGPQGEHL